jgi:vesicular inhibitory amino acid transporter
MRPDLHLTARRIISTVLLLVVVYVDGASKPDAPGSLVRHAMTNVGPDWKRLPLSFGLVMSGVRRPFKCIHEAKGSQFSGHAVMPQIARDMRSEFCAAGCQTAERATAGPRHFDTMINLAYIVAFAMYLMMAVAGYLMLVRSHCVAPCSSARKVWKQRH